MRIILLLLLLPTLLYSQDSQLVWLSRPISGGETLLIDYDGKVRCKLAADDRPVITSNNSALGPFFMSALRTYDFANGPMPVISNRAFRLIDIDGNVVADLGAKYRRVLPPQAGNIIAMEQSDQRRKGYLDEYYLNTKGEVLHDSMAYAEATYYTSEIAVVKEIGPEGIWKIIDRKGKKIATFSGPFAPYIYGVKKIADDRIVANIKRPQTYSRDKYIYSTVIYDTKGNQIKTAKELVGRYDNVGVSDYCYGFSIVKDYKVCKVIDKEGEVIGELTCSDSQPGITKDYIAVKGWQHYDLYNHDLQPINLVPKAGAHLTRIKSVSDEYVTVLEVDTIQKIATKKILQASDLSEVYTLDAQTIIMSLQPDRIALGVREGLSNKLEKIIDMDGRIIYEIPARDRVFGDVAEALQYKDEVRYLNLKAPKDLNQLPLFTKLEVLEISRAEQTSMPNLSTLQNLDRLVLTSCENLAALPEGLSQTALKNMYVGDCNNLKNVETTVRNTKSLIKVTTHDYDFEEGFDKEMKTARPDLVLDAWQSSGWEDQEVEEELPPPPPPPPAPKRKKNR